MKNSVFGIKRQHFTVLVTLISIIVVGIIGIPFGDPRFIVYAIFLELVYVSLAILVANQQNNEPVTTHQHHGTDSWWILAARPVGVYKCNGIKRK
jgi:hypothetical protein